MTRSQLTEVELAADEFAQAFQQFVFTVVDDEQTIAHLWDRFAKALLAAPVGSALLMPLVGALLAIHRANAARQRRIEQLERRVTELAARPKGLLYAGVFDKANAPYERDVAVTHSGSCWASTVEGATSVPGTDNQWQLCVKRGRDARDGR